MLDVVLAICFSGESDHGRGLPDCALVCLLGAAVYKELTV